MKPSKFDYYCPNTIAEIHELLNVHEDAMILSGGQSLIPAMNFRLASPMALIDIGKIDELRYIETTSDKITIGARTTHHEVETNEQVYQANPILRLALKHVAHLPIRHRGTTVGSLCHADASAEMPMVLLLTDGSLNATNGQGSREIPAEDFFQFHLTTTRQSDEFIESASFGVLPKGSGAGFVEFSRRKGDFALAAVGAIVELDDKQNITNLRLAACGIGNTPVRLKDAETFLIGKHLNEENLEQAGKIAKESVTAADDANATNDYRKHLLKGLLQRAILQGANDAGGQSK